MGHTPWELIFVDDDSPDGTRHEIAALVQEGAPVRCLRRVGRRGLASAVVEGAMSANGEIIAVIDADMQHDETLLPRMLRRLQTTDSDVVIASRHVEEGSLGDLHAHRRLVSALATLFAKLLIGESLRDPMSGFFMTRRSVFDATIYDLSQQGYKILLDILTSSQRPLKVVEVPYVFRDRRSGQSKLDAMVIAEYAFLLIEKLSYGLVPARFVLFSFVGGLGLFVHLAILTQLKMLGIEFLRAQIISTILAMTFNYVVNNFLTYRAERLKGWQFLIGYVVFGAICSLGAIANISVANLTLSQGTNWPLAGAAGAIMSAVFNFSMSTKIVWGRSRKPSTSRIITGASLATQKTTPIAVTSP
jgi:dolichol-phosphate mannosyltransferase